MKAAITACLCSGITVAMLMLIPSLTSNKSTFAQQAAQNSQPLAFSIQQSVPLSLTFALSSNPPQTETVALTLDFDLGVTITAPTSATVQMVGASYKEVAPLLDTNDVESNVVSEGEDRFDLQYEIIGEFEGIKISEWNVVNLNGNMGHAVLGKLTISDAQRVLEDLELEIRYYDEAGDLLNIKTGRLLGNPADKSIDDVIGFELWGGVNLQPEDFSSYTIEIAPFWQN